MLIGCTDAIRLKEVGGASPVEEEKMRYTTGNSMKTERNASLRSNANQENDRILQEHILDTLLIIKEDCRVLRARMVSLESWMAALSKGKNLDESHAFAKNIKALKQELEEETISVYSASDFPIKTLSITNDCK